MVNKDSFLGTGWSFPPTFSKVINAVETVSDVQDIVQSLKILFNTTPGERIMFEDFGGGLKDMLFEPMDLSTKTLITERLKTAILQYEARIEVTDMKLLNSQEEGRIDIEIEFVVRTSNTRVNLVFPFYQLEATDVTNKPI